MVDQAVPGWLRGVRSTLDADVPEWFARFAPPPTPGRRSAVLVLFGESDDGLHVVLTERAAGLRSHAAQVAFPGGRIDPGDAGPREAALREAREEAGIDPGSIEVVDELPALYLHPTQDAVTPVLGWWHDPHPIGVVDPVEVARVDLAPVAQLVDPANRFTVTGPRGYRGPGFAVGELFVWGFTGTLLDHVLDLAGLTRPWDADVTRPLPWRLLAPYLRGRLRR